MGDRRRRGSGPAAAPVRVPGPGPTGPRRPAAPAAAVAAPGRGENRPSPSLVIATFLGRESEWVDLETGEIGTPPVSVGMIEYPDGGGELYGVRTGKGGGVAGSDVRERQLRRTEELLYGPERASELASERRAARARRSEQEAARRARSRVRRICRMYSLRFMVTLTFPGEGVHEYDRALRLLQDFIHDHGQLLHLGGAWLAVPELHPGGHGWHWHILVSRRFKKDELAALRTGWTEYLRRRDMAPSGGAVYTRIDVKAWGSADKAAAYAAKYAGKSFNGDDRRKGRKRYLFKKGIEVPVTRGGAQTLDEVREAVALIGAESVYQSSDDPEWSGPPMVWGSWDGHADT